MMRFNVSEINECIRTRRSIYPAQFSERRVAKELIEVMLENARWAPTHKLTQPWRFKVFYGKGVKTFAEFHSEKYKAITSEADFKPMKYKKLRNNAEKSSAIIALIMHRDEQERVPEEEEIASVAMAVQNIYLTCSAYGLAGYWGSGGLTRTPEMHDFLHLANNERCMGFFYLGYPALDWPKKTERMERRSIMEWIEE